MGLVALLGTPPALFLVLGHNQKMLVGVLNTLLTPSVGSSLWGSWHVWRRATVWKVVTKNNLKYAVSRLMSSLFIHSMNKIT